MGSFVNDITKIVLTSLTLTIITFGWLYLCYDTLFHYLPLGAIVACSLVGAAFVLRVPQPDSDAVEAILGPDPFTATKDTNIVPGFTTGAHRGAGLDAPENSLAAFKLVRFELVLKLIIERFVFVF